jgi:F420-non-reducing hydrogenase iron-sulfur subunit
MSVKNVVFFCEWSTHPGLKLSRLVDGNSESESENKMIVGMCQGRISPELIMETFSEGAWGVLIASCPTDECEHDGNYKARRRILLTKNVMKQLGIAPQRLRLEWIGKGEAPKFKKVVDEFNQEMSKLGPIN